MTDANLMDAACIHGVVWFECDECCKQEERLPEWPETHKQGLVSIENQGTIEAILDASTEADFGVQIAWDGRVWVCINGIAWIRFKPKVVNDG